MGNHIKRIILFFLCISVFAEDVKISHEVRNLKLPLPMENITISAVIAGNNSFAQIRGLFNLDGNLIEAHSSMGRINENEMMQYDFIIPSPVKYLDYEFFTEGASSSKYSLKRDCKYDLTYDEQYQGNNLVQNLRIKSKALEHNLKLIEQSLTSAEYLKKELQ